VRSHSSSSRKRAASASHPAAVPVAGEEPLPAGSSSVRAASCIWASPFTWYCHGRPVHAALAHRIAPNLTKLTLPPSPISAPSLPAIVPARDSFVAPSQIPPCCLSCDRATSARRPCIIADAQTSPLLRARVLAPPVRRWNFGNSQRATSRPPHLPFATTPNAPSATPHRRASHRRRHATCPIGPSLSSSRREPFSRAPGRLAPPGNVLCASASRPDHVKWWHWERHHGSIRHHRPVGPQCSRYECASSCRRARCKWYQQQTTPAPAPRHVAAAIVPSRAACQLHPPRAYVERCRC
jgi:hypothetical protein